MLTPIGEALQQEMDISGSFDGPEEVQSNTGSRNFAVNFDEKWKILKAGAC
jgi:hypothetical protein